jgi:hypothetical protein
MKNQQSETALTASRAGHACKQDEKNYRTNHRIHLFEHQHDPGKMFR